MTKQEKCDHLYHILFELIDSTIMKCSHCGYPYKEGHICLNCGAEEADDEENEEYPLEELL